MNMVVMDEYYEFDHQMRYRGAFYVHFFWLANLCKPYRVNFPLGIDGYRKNSRWVEAALCAYRVCLYHLIRSLTWAEE